MEIYQIIAVRTHIDNERARNVEAVKIGESWYLIDQIIHWIEKGDHQFIVRHDDRDHRVVAGWHGSSQRHFLTTEGCGFPSKILLSLPRG